MSSEFPMNDPRNVWQNQPTEPFKMSAEEIRRKAQQRQTKARLIVILSIVMGLFLSVCFAWNLARVHEVVPRMGWGLLSLWAVYFAYQAYKWIWPGRLEPDATVSTSLEFCRSELERRRDYGLHIWRRAGLTFCFLGLAMVVLPRLIKSLAAPRLLLNAVPFFVLLIIWVAGFIYSKKRNRQRLEQDIDELRVLERENRS